MDQSVTKKLAQTQPVNKYKDEVKKLETRIKSLTTQLKNLQEKDESGDAAKYGVSLNMKELVKHIAMLRIAHARIPRGGSRSIALMKLILNLDSMAEAKEVFNKVIEERKYADGSKENSGSPEAQDEKQASE